MSGSNERRGLRLAGMLAAALCVVWIGAALRFEAPRWDDGHLLHPDERFLVMLAADARIPDTLSDYLDAERSPLNPHNLGRDFFVYGTLPLTTLVAAEAVVDGRDLSKISFLGRRLAATADLGTLLVTMLIAFCLVRRPRDADGGASGLMAAVSAGAFYALAVLPIQAAHFFTTDPFLVLLGNGSLLLALLAGNRRSVLLAGGAGLALGLALACKLPALLFAPLWLAWIALPRDPSEGRWLARRAIPQIALASVCAYLGLRIGDPVFFASANWLDPRPSPELLGGLEQLADWSRLDGFYPPAIQWIDRMPALFPLVNLAGVGLGIPLFLLSVLGVGLGLRARSPVPPRANDWLRCVAALWIVLAFGLLSLRTVQTLRYFLPLLPILLVLAALGAHDLLARARPGVRPALALVTLAALLIWPLSFRSIYAEAHTRVRASTWIRAHAAPGSSIAHEHWDDRLPLARGHGETRYAFRELPVFEPDSDFKWHRLDALLEGSDFLVLSSNRGYGSIGRVPEKYPRMARFYDDLFAGRTAFELEAEFTSFPRLFGLAFDDQWAEEAFSVYDHPKVSVFRRVRR